MDFYSAYAHGFARVAACTLPVAIADPAANARAVLAQARACHDDAVAVAGGDQKGELEAIKGLVARRPGDLALAERRAQLELAVGDPGTGLKLIQTLADRRPNDPAIAAQLAAAKFRWQLSLLPRDVQEIAARPELDKASFSVLLYWLVPEVRAAHPSAGRIATDGGESHLVTRRISADLPCASNPSSCANFWTAFSDFFSAGRSYWITLVRCWN